MGAQRHIDRAHRRAKGLRHNAHDYISRTLVQKYHTLGIETLNDAGMVKADLQSKALADAGISSPLGQVLSKAQRHGTRIVKADRW